MNELREEVQLALVLAIVPFLQGVATLQKLHAPPEADSINRLLLGCALFTPDKLFFESAHDLDQQVVGYNPTAPGLSP